MWDICFTLSIVALLAAILYGILLKRKHRNGSLLSTFHVLFAGVFAAAFIGMIPLFCEMVSGESNRIAKLIIFDVIQTLQAFTINIGAADILEIINSSGAGVSVAYSIYMAMLFFLAPIMTFGFLISLFREVISETVYLLRYSAEVYAFTELNERSVILAEDIRKNHRKALLLFAEVDDESGEKGELVQRAKEIGALLFHKDFLSIHLDHHSKDASVTILAIGKQEENNLIRALKLRSRYGSRKNTNLYVFSNTMEGELLLAGTKESEIKVRRVNEVRSLIYRYLYDQGTELFRNADEKGEIHAVVLGMGSYGTELVKALTWYCQMDGYHIHIDAYDQDEQAEEQFAALCPELMSERYNGVSIQGECEYRIQIHSGIDVRTRTFAEQLREEGKPTVIFVCLGNDSTNINQAANVRMLCERYGSNPRIFAIVHSSEKKEVLKDIINFREQPYGIEAFGDLESMYSEEVLLGSELEHLALERHLKWGKEEKFWRYEYNYRSSMASAVHMKARILCGIPGADKEEEKLTLEERDIIEKLEHRRWNAYMRSEGYVYSGSPDKSSLNHLAKMHHDLVDFETLTEEEKRKDSSVGTR